MRPKIIEENIDNFNAVTKDMVARFVKLNKACGPNDHMPDLEGELSKWATESKFVLLYIYTKAPLNIVYTLISLKYCRLILLYCFLECNLAMCCKKKKKKKKEVGT